MHVYIVLDAKTAPADRNEVKMEIENTADTALPTHPTQRESGSREKQAEVPETPRTPGVGPQPLRTVSEAGMMSRHVFN